MEILTKFQVLYTIAWDIKFIKIRLSEPKDILVTVYKIFLEQYLVIKK